MRRAFQKKVGLKQDGKYGDQTHAALMAAVADNDVGQQTEPETQLELEQPTGTKVKIVCDNGTVNIRVGNGTDYARITAVPDGTEFEHVATAANGWHAVKVGSQVGWVSGSTARLQRNKAAGLQSGCIEPDCRPWFLCPVKINTSHVFRHDQARRSVPYLPMSARNRTGQGSPVYVPDWMNRESPRYRVAGPSAE